MENNLKGKCVLVSSGNIIHMSISNIDYDYPQPVRRHYHPKYTLITLAPVSYLRSFSGQSSAPASHRRGFDSYRKTYS